MLAANNNFDLVPVVILESKDGLQVADIREHRVIDKLESKGVRVLGQIREGKEKEMELGVQLLCMEEKTQRVQVM